MLTYWRTGGQAFNIARIEHWWQRNLGQPYRVPHQVPMGDRDGVLAMLPMVGIIAQLAIIITTLVKTMPMKMMSSIQVTVENLILSLPIDATIFP